MALPRLSPQLPEDKEAFQCSWRACRKAERPSTIRSMATVSMGKTPKMIKMPTSPPQPRRRRLMLITMVHSTSQSSEGARVILSLQLCHVHISQPVTSGAKVPLRALQEHVCHSSDHCGGASSKKKQTITHYHTVITRKSKPTGAVSSKRDKFEIT